MQESSSEGVEGWITLQAVGPSVLVTLKVLVVKPGVDPLFFLQSLSLFKPHQVLSASSGGRPGLLEKLSVQDESALLRLVPEPTLLCS